MRLFRFIALGLVAFLVAVGGAFAYSMRAPYELPPDSAPKAARPFTATAPRRAQDRTVVVLVFDGFAPSTARAADAPSLARMAAEGAHTLDMMPVFPSLSMPNHFSLSTGCQPARHGVVSNHFRDPKRGFYIDKGDADWLLACEPLHVVAERQGVRSAVFAHVGAISGTRGALASVAEGYVSPPRTASEQVDRVIAQLERPAAERPGLITAYVTEPDSTSHDHGPTGKETLAVAHAMDVQIGRTIAAIERLGLRDRVTLIVTTDHGMLGVDKVVSPERLLRIAGISGLALADGSVAHIYLDDPSRKAEALAALRKHAFLDVIDPAAPPAWAKLGTSKRVGDLVLSVHRGHYTFDLGFWPPFLRWASFVGPGVSPSKRFGGMHGYDPERVPEVRSIFHAWGAGVKRGATLPGMRTIDVHPTVTRLLGIEPGAPLDGHAREDLLAL